ncbi:acyltransferase family protein [Pseudonocardia abyssalis]|uniref:Acyltransferase n=1 Tax=Pseudonocardia abyssalis TaxID=2792008 RepID=A0ABS6UTX0_9PSEU|nr:acyltransferase [Pseudonocardia abyssalis]MBW0116085.1 acyltransferase [Pseudonocardia abyssalis]MBW0135708.1 acyltransferase [Pseudonocardia abyssalis]
MIDTRPDTSVRVSLLSRESRHLRKETIIDAPTVTPGPAILRDPTALRGTPLAQAFEPRRNSVNALRLALAGIVLISHSLKFQGYEDPVGHLTGGDVDMGTMAVDGFFALSGFLILGSWLSSPSTGRYLWRRCLRILPGFWACLVVSSFVLLPVASLLEFGTLAGFPWTGEQSALTYVVDNAALFVRQYEVPGVFGGEAVNGSLYTLFYEFACYLAVAALGALGLLRDRLWPLLAVAAAVWLLALSELLDGAVLTSRSSTLEIALRFGSMFLAGAVAARVGPRLPMGPAGGAVAVLVLVQAVVLASMATTPEASTLVYVVIAPAAVAYLVLLAGASPRLHRIGSRRDLSYGLYVYAWPVQAMLLLVGAAAWPLPLYAAASLAGGLALALASWTWVESSALRFKSWTPGPFRA